MTVLGEAWVNIGANTAPLTAGLNGAKAQVSKATMEMRARLKTLGTSMTIVGALGVVAFGLTVKSAMKFQKELAQVSTMLDESSMKIMPEYKKKLLEMSAAFGEGTNTLANGLYDILSASIDSSKALDVLEEAAKAAVAGITDTGVAADAITTILNSYGLEAEDAGKISDQLFAIVKRGKTTFAELAPSIGKVAATASISGLSFEDLGASIATITRAGIRTEEAMTAINGVLRAFLKPTDDAKTAAKEFGLTMDTNTLRTIGLTGVMGKLKEATAEQLAAMFPNIRGLKGMAAALGDLEGYTKDYNLMLNATGLTQTAFEKQTATVAFKLEQLKKTFGVISVQIGDVLIPIVSDMVVGLGKIIKKVSDWIEKNKPLVTVLVKLGAALSVFTMAGGLLILMNLYIKNLTLSLAGMGKTATTLVPKMATLQASLNTLGGAVLVVGANIIIWSEVWKEWQKIANSVKTTQEDVIDALIKFSDAQVYAAEKMGITVQEFVKMQKEGASVTEMIKGMTEEMEENIKKIKETAAVQSFYILAMAKLKEEAEKGTISVKVLYEEMKKLDEILEKGTIAFDDQIEELTKAQKAYDVLQDFLKPVRETITELTKELTSYEQKIADVNAKYDDMIEAIKMFNVSEEIQKTKIDEVNIARDLEIRKLEEAKTAAEELVKAKKKLADLTKSLTDKIYEFTHTEYEVKLRDINREYDLLVGNAKEVYKSEYELAKAIEIINEKRQEEIDKLKELHPEKGKDIKNTDDLADSYKELKKPIEEVIVVTEKLGILGGNTWEGFTTQINRASAALSNFTKAGVAAAIAQIKMKFFPVLNDLYKSLETAGYYTFIVQGQINNVLKMLNEQIAQVLYGLDVYNEELEKLGGTTESLADKTSSFGGSIISSWNKVTDAIEETEEAIEDVKDAMDEIITTAPGIWGMSGGTAAPSYQTGTPYVPETGLALVHKGEEINPPGQRSYDYSQKSFSPTVNLTMQGGGSAVNIAREIEKVLYDMGKQFKRRGFEIIPGGV